MILLQVGDSFLPITVSSHQPQQNQLREGMFGLQVQRAVCEVLTQRSLHWARPAACTYSALPETSEVPQGFTFTCKAYLRQDLKCLHSSTRLITHFSLDLGEEKLKQAKNRRTD